MEERKHRKEPTYKGGRVVSEALRWLREKKNGYVAK